MDTGMSVSDQDIKDGRINDELSSQLESISARVEANVEKGKNAWADFRADAEGRFREMAAATDRCVHDRPWQAIGVAAGAGLLLGLLCARR
jgi:ElaB/YqjD/DUF883 family membrane-anchored ribosome-binding protein